MTEQRRKRVARAASSRSMRAAMTPWTESGSASPRVARSRSSRRRAARARPARSASAASPRRRTDCPPRSRGSARARPPETRSSPSSARRAVADSSAESGDEVERDRVLLAGAPARALIEELGPRRADEQHAASRRASRRAARAGRAAAPRPSGCPRSTSTVSCSRPSARCSAARRPPEPRATYSGSAVDDRRAGQRDADRPGGRLDHALRLAGRHDGCDRGPQLRERHFGGVGLEDPGLRLRDLGRAGSR